MPLEECTLASVGTAERAQARCGWVRVPLNWDEPDGERIELRFALLAADGGQRAAAPLFFIPGGPGQSAIESFAPLAPAFALVRRHRDIVVVDPRGTGASAPFVCALPDDIDDAAARDKVVACARSLGNAPRQVHTASLTRDLDAVRERLGYRQIDVYAASYGTRVALELARAAPATIRSMVLDGVTASQTVLGAEQLLHAERALQALWQRCAERLDCAVRYGNLHDTFMKVRGDLAETPRELALRDPLHGERKTLTLTARRFEDTVRSALYQSELVALLPKLVDEAAHGDYSGLGSMALSLQSTFARAVNHVAYAAVVCHDDIPFLQPVVPTDFFRAHIEELVELCKEFPTGRAPVARTAVISAIPTLMISGENDPVTPPDEANEAALTLSRVKRIVLREQGHIGMYRGCVPRLIGDFLDSAQPETLDVSCAERVRALPMFTGANGP